MIHTVPNFRYSELKTKFTIYCRVSDFVVIVVVEIHRMIGFKNLVRMN